MLSGIEAFSVREAGELFERSFNEPFDARLWQWKYGEGRGRAVCAHEQGRLVAHYGGIARPIRYMGEPEQAIQVCDVMVSPDKRQFYSRRGLFFRVASSFLERNIGYGREHLLGFGFPNRGVMQAAQRLGLYQKTDDFLELRFPRTLHATANDWQVHSLPPAKLVEVAALDSLWRDMRADFSQSIIGVRDREYLLYRYARHPAVHYESLLIRNPGGTLQAVAFIRMHEGKALLMDLVAPAARMPAAITALVRHLDARGMSLKCWITGGHVDKLQIPGSELTELGIEIPCNAWSDGPHSRELAGRWWLTAGDMDFL